MILGKPKTEKYVVAISAGVAGYTLLAPAMEALPSIPSVITNPIFGTISLLTIVGGLTIYSAFVLLTKY